MLLIYLSATNSESVHGTMQFVMSLVDLCGPLFCLRGKASAISCWNEASRTAYDKPCLPLVRLAYLNCISKIQAAYVKRNLWQLISLHRRVR